VRKLSPKKKPAIPWLTNLDRVAKKIKLRRKKMSRGSGSNA